ncbi:LPXTG cell wall anchor domain-containing protein [Enterococcus sp. DIV0876]|uniref:LPXTG cell wall anchor domain-containing protein n=1 Tax=Enterococcus sp. DIV0876 TaxID=2774633 RepID=UPI003D2FE2F4
MKKIMISAVTCCLLLFPQLVSAAEAGAYDSNGVTSFFGVYEDPVEEPKEVPKEQPGNKQVNQKGNNILPATGSDHLNSYQNSGLIILLIAGIIIIKRRTKNEKTFLDSRYSANEHNALANNSERS